MALENKVWVYMNPVVYGKMKENVVAAFESLSDANRFAESIAPTGTKGEPYVRVEVKQGKAVIHFWGEPK